MEELDKLLVGDLEPVIADLPTVPKDDIKDIDDQLPDVPTTVPIIIIIWQSSSSLLQEQSTWYNLLDLRTRDICNRRIMR